MRLDIVLGAIFSDYELPDHTTKHRKLSKLQGQYPMVLRATHVGRAMPGSTRRSPEMPTDWDITTPELKAAWQEG